MALLALAAAFTVPSVAEEPWAVDAPGVAGSRFGLGLESFFEHQESLRFSFLETSIRVRDLLLGIEGGGVSPGDPALLNRKFDLVLELTGAGTTFPVALPHLGPLYPTLVFQAAEVDLDLGFEGRTLSSDRSTLGGRGSLFGTGVDVVASLCRSCPWFVESGYRYQRLPWMSVDRTPSFAPSGFAILEDEVRLASEVQEVSTRAGYGFPGNRMTSYVGVSHRWTEVNIEDELRYLDPSGELETTLSSRTDLESEITLALAGVQAHLGGGFYGKLETSRSDNNDWGVLAQVVYLAQSGRDKTTENHEDEQDPRAREIAQAIAPDLAAIEKAFLDGWKNLKVVEGPDGRPAYLAREVEDLLTKTEDDILAVLGAYPELEALGDWVSDEFSAARVELGLATGRPQVAGPVLTAYAALQTTIEKERADAVLGSRARNGVAKPRQLSEEEKLQVALTFETSLDGRPRLRIFPRNDRRSTRAQLFGRGDSLRIFLGAYSFEVFTRDGILVSCDARASGPDSPCPLDLISNRCDVLWCDDQDDRDDPECHCQ